MLLYKSRFQVRGKKIKNTKGEGSIILDVREKDLIKHEKAQYSKALSMQICLQIS
jgi:hypothetical protein